MKGLFNRECAIWYANTNVQDIDEDNITDNELIALIKGELGDQDFTCDQCNHFIQDDDVTCWFCGNDVSEDESGGFKPSKKEKKKADKKEKKKIDKKEKKKEKKKVDKKEKKKEKKVDKEEDEENEESSDEVSLEQATENIKNLDKSTGSNAWMIGKILFDINESKKYKQSYKTFEDYCKTELGQTYQTAYNYIRIAERFTQDEACKLGVFKLVTLAKAPDSVRPKLIKAAMSKEDGGKGLDRDSLKAEIKKAREKAGKKSNSPGRPSSSPFKRFVDGDEYSGSLDKKSGVYLIELDDMVGVEVKLSGKNATKVKFSFVELETE